MSQVNNETRRVLMKEVNSLGEQLELELNTKNKAIRKRKKLETDFIDLENSLESSSMSKNETDKLRKKAEQLSKDVQMNQELKEKLILKGSAQRQKQKASTLQTEYEMREEL